MAEGKEVKKKGISRRDFIKGTGLAVGGVAISSTVLGVACTPTQTIPPNPNTTTNPTTPPTNTTTAPPNKTTAPPNNNTTAPPNTTTAPPNTTTPPTTNPGQGGTTPAPVVNENVHFTVDGNAVAVKVQDWWTLNYVLRESLSMQGPVKYSCDEGICGMCTVIMNGKLQLSCMTLATECEGATINTVAGLRDPKTGKLHAIQQGFINESGFMCGFCTTGQIMAAKVLLDANPSPTLADVKEALSGNLCLCGGYELIQKSVLNAATLLKGG